MLTTFGGRLRIADCKLVRDAGDDVEGCCCPVTCCGGTCDQKPACRVFVRFTLADECVPVAGVCKQFSESGDMFFRVVDSAEDCDCSHPDVLCEQYEYGPQKLVDIEITDLFGNADGPPAAPGGPCFAYLKYPEGGRPATTFYFKPNGSDNQWMSVGNWFRDKNFQQPAGSIPTSDSAVFISGHAVQRPANFRMAVEDNDDPYGKPPFVASPVNPLDLPINELVLVDGGQVIGEIRVKKLRVAGGVIAEGSQVVVQGKIDATDITIAGMLVLRGSTDAVFRGDSVVTATGRIRHNSSGKITFIDKGLNAGTIIVRYGVQVAFRDEAKNTGLIQGGFPRFVKAAENLGVLRPMNTSGSAAEATFVGSARNKGEIFGTAAFAFLNEQAITDEENKIIIAANDGFISEKAGFFTGAQNLGIVEGHAEFQHGDNYGTVGTANFFTTIQAGNAGFSGGRSSNYGTVLTNAAFYGSSTANEGSHNYGCVGQQAWFSPESINDGQPSTLIGTSANGSKLYECTTGECCSSSEFTQLPNTAPPKLASTGEVTEENFDTPPDTGSIDFSEEDATAGLTCEERLLDCLMNLRVSKACRHVRTCHAANPEASVSGNGVTCSYQIKILIGYTRFDDQPRPIYADVGSHQNLWCYGIEKIEIVEFCPKTYSTTTTVGGTCQEKLPAQRCQRNGGRSAFLHTPGRHPTCEETPCVVCCGTAYRDPFTGLPTGRYACDSLWQIDAVTGTPPPFDGTATTGITADECVRCEKFCVDRDGVEREVDSPFECRPCFDAAPDSPSDCNSEFFLARGFCGILIPGTDGVLQELAICGGSVRSDRCPPEDFPAVLCASGDFIDEFFVDQNQLPNARLLGLGDSGTLSYPGGPFGWGYSTAVRSIVLRTNICGGWHFYMRADTAFFFGVPPGEQAPGGSIQLSGEVRTVTACDTCFPESVTAYGTLTRWVKDFGNPPAFQPIETPVTAAISFSAGYRCGTAPSVFPSCIPCDEINPPEEAIKARPTLAATDIATPANDWRTGTVVEEDLPPNVKKTLAELRAGNPDKIISVIRSSEKRYMFQAVEAADETRYTTAAIKLPEPDCAYSTDDPTGPGTYLSGTLEKIGIKAKPDCPCRARARTMNCHGPDWCEENIDTIVGWLREEATKRRLPFVDLAGKLLVKRAISLSRAAKKKERLNTPSA